MGNVVSYFMQKPEGVPVAKKEGCCSENKIERIEDPASNVASEEIIETSATQNVGDQNFHVTQKLKETDVGDDFEIIPEEKQQKPADISEAAAQKVDEIEEKFVSSKNEHLLESLISDNKQTIELDDKNQAEQTETLLPDQQEGLQTEISASTDACEVAVQNSTKTDIIQEDLCAKDHDQIGALEMKDDGEEITVEDIKQEQNMEDLNDNDRDISEAEEKDDSTEHKIALSEEQTKSDSENFPGTLSQIEEQSSCVQEPTDLDTIKVDSELADTEEVAFDKKLNMNPGQEESLLDTQKDVDVESHATDITVKDIDMIECNQNEIKTENHGYESQDAIKTTELCDETPDITSHNESVECTEDESAETIEDSEELENGKNADADTIKSTIELDCTAEETPDQVSNIETVAPFKETVEDNLCKDDLNKDPQANCEKVEEVDVLESTTKDNPDENEECKSAEMIQSDQENTPEDCNTIEGILDQESDIDTSASKPDKIEGEEILSENIDDRGTELIGSIEETIQDALFKDDLTKDPQANCEKVDDVDGLESTTKDNPDENEESKSAEMIQSDQENKPEDCNTIEGILDQESDIDTSRPDKIESKEILSENVDEGETELIGSIENYEKHFVYEPLEQTDILNSLEEPIEGENKEINTEKVTEKKLEEEDAFSKVIDNCKMEIENIQNSIAGPVETEEIGEKKNFIEVNCSSQELDQVILSARGNDTDSSENVESLSNNPSKESFIDHEKVEDQSESLEKATEEVKTKSDEDTCEGSTPDEQDIHSSVATSVHESTEEKIKDTVIASNNGFSNENEYVEDMTTTKETETEFGNELELK